MATFLPSPAGKYQFFDNNGNPLAGGSVTTYLAGTSTLQATAKNATGSAMNTPTITLDAGGFADIWLDITKSYKFVVSNAGGSFTYMVDNISVTNGDNALRGDLASTSDASKGDALVEVVQPFTGAAPRTQHSKNADILTPEDCGAVGDGTTDDAAAIQSWLNACITNRKTGIATGKYKCNSRVAPTFTAANAVLSIIGQGAQFDFSGSTNGGFLFAGATNLEGTLASTVVAGGRTVTNSSTPSSAVAPGAVILLVNTTNSSFSTINALYHAGEMALVQSLAGSVITLDTDLIAGYTSGANIQIRTLTPAPVVRMTGCVIIGSANAQYGISLHWCRDSVLDNCKVVNFTDNGILIGESWNTVVTNCVLEKAAADGDSTSNCLILYNCQRALIAHNHLTSPRQGILVGVFSTIVSVPCRDITVDDCTINVGGASSGQALTFLGNTEKWLVRNCHVRGQVGMGGSSGSLLGNMLTPLVNRGSILCGEMNTLNFSLTGNRCSTTIPNTTAGKGIFVDGTPPASTANTGEMVIEGNQVLYAPGAETVAAYLIALSSSSYFNVHVRHNKLEMKNSTSLNHYAIYLAAFTNGDVQGNYCYGGGIYATTNGLAVENNIVAAASDRGIYVLSLFDAGGGPMPYPSMSLHGNVVDAAGTTGISCDASAQDWGTLMLEGNHVTNASRRGSTGDAHQDGELYVIGASTALLVFARDNLLYDDTFGHAVQCAYYKNLTSLYEAHNEYIGLASTLVSVTTKFGQIAGAYTIGTGYTASRNLPNAGTQTLLDACNVLVQVIKDIQAHRVTL